MATSARTIKLASLNSTDYEGIEMLLEQVTPRSVSALFKVTEITMQLFRVNFCLIVGYKYCVAEGRVRRQGIFP